MSFAGCTYLTESGKKVLAHGAISHFAVALDAVAQLVNSCVLVQRFSHVGTFAPTPAHKMPLENGVRGWGSVQLIL